MLLSALCCDALRYSCSFGKPLHSTVCLHTCVEHIHSDLVFARHSLCMCHCLILCEACGQIQRCCCCPFASLWIWLTGLVFTFIAESTALFSKGSSSQFPCLTYTKHAGNMLTYIQLMVPAASHTSDRQHMVDTHTHTYTYTHTASCCYL